ncbi:response regulator transcription factor [Alicyclobacillus macrosporangiidus]|uniref:response regulator transcription factor n=1 Tax=Alicyclobacillus macrosporangiidus TaxID=392015 RepID=UPI0004951345|nr:response regulator transcription factor [Alicyclobacillus macrosporangiidus]
MEQAREIRLLVVDDEPGILEFLELGLRNEGFQVHTAPDGPSALAAAQAVRPHVVILDVMLPGLDGFAVCRALKEMGDVVVILLTAKDAVADRVRGLDIGADDYVVKPFSFEELLARIRARLRGQFPYLGKEVVIGPFRIDDGRKEIAFQGRLLALSATEYELLKYLVLHHDTVVSKARLLDHVWGYDFGGQDNIVEVYIRSLRDKLGDDEHRVIRTIRGAGYRLDLP